MGLKTVICTDCGQVVLKDAAYRCERCDQYFCKDCMFMQDCCAACRFQESPPTLAQVLGALLFSGGGSE